MLSAEQAAIERAFFADLLQTPMQDRMTTVEVLQRRGERAQLLSPTVSRIQMEYLGPTIARTFAIMLRAGALAPPPPEVAGLALDVEYVSPLASLQRSSELEGIVRTLGIAGELGQFDPRAAQVFEGEEVVRFFAEVTNVPQRVLRSREKLAELAAQQAQQAAAREQVETARELAAAAADGGKAVKELSGAA